MVLALLITLTLALGGAGILYLWLRAPAPLETEEDLAQLVQGRRTPVVESLERWDRKNK